MLTNYFNRTLKDCGIKNIIPRLTVGNNFTIRYTIGFPWIYSRHDYALTTILGPTLNYLKTPVRVGLTLEDKNMIIFVGPTLKDPQNPL